MKRRSCWILSLALISAPILGCEKPQPKDPPPVPVTAAVAERRSVPRTLEATGSVEPVATVAIQSQVTGVLQRVLFTEGQDVRAGQVLFEIDPRTYRAALEGAQAALARDLSQVATARENARRLAELGPDYATRQQIAQAQANALCLWAANRAATAPRERPALDRMVRETRAALAKSS